MSERIEAAAKLRYDRIHGEGSYDQLSVGEMVDLCDEIEASVSAWLKAGKPIWEYEPEGGEYEPAADRVQDFSDTGRPMGEWVRVKSDD